MTDGNGHRDPATPQEIWEILREISAAQQEAERRMQETDRQMQETDRRLQATDELITRQTRAADRRMDELDKLFNGQWGKLMESLVEGDLVGLLQQRGIAVQHTVTNPRQNYGERRWELDIVAVNGEEVVVVEVKTTLRVPDIDRFVGRLNEFPDLMPEYAGRRIYGAVAYLKALPGVGRTCRAAGPVRDSCHRQQRQHHQPGGVHAAHVRSPEHGTQPPIARSRPPFVSKWPSPDGEYAEQEPHEPQARNRV